MSSQCNKDTRCIKPLTTIHHHYLSYPKPAAKRWAFTTNFRQGIGPPGVPMSPKAIGWPCQVRAIVVAPGMDIVREMGIEWNVLEWFEMIMMSYSVFFMFFFKYDVGELAICYLWI